MSNVCAPTSDPQPPIAGNWVLEGIVNEETVASTICLYVCMYMHTLYRYVYIYIYVCVCAYLSIYLSLCLFTLLRLGFLKLHL